MYPSGYDVLISKHEMLINVSSVFDKVHEYLKDLRKSNPRDALLRPHKVAKYVSEKLTNYIHDYIPSYLENENGQCNNGGCIPTRQLGGGIVGCELCNKSFYLYEIKTESVI